MGILGKPKFTYHMKNQENLNLRRKRTHRGHKMTAYWGCLIKTLKQLLQKHSKK